MTADESDVKAQMQCEELGTLNLPKLHLLLKYLGRNRDDELNERRFFNTIWTVKDIKISEAR